MVSEEQESEMELASEKIPVPPVENVIEEPVEDEEPKPEGFRKKPRKRHRELHASILKQMEFYFGDANLSKDRFLSRLISQDPWVDLNEFIKFNKIAALTTDINRIAKALRISKMLAISEDGTKVRRTTPIRQKDNSDECTVYVQKLPPEADHDWISKMFSPYGSIDYISIPKYKNKAIKGFAFVEFKTPEDVVKCIKAFKEKGGLLPSETSPNTLLSITTHENCDDEIARKVILKKEKNPEEMETEKTEEIDSNDKNKAEISQNEKKKKKRLSLDETVNDEDEHSKKAKKKKYDNTGENSDSANVEKESKKLKKQKAKNSESHNDTDGNEEVNDSSASDCDKKQKKGKRKAVELESKKLSDQEAESQSDAETVPKKVRKTDKNEENGSNKEKKSNSEEENKETDTEEKQEDPVPEGETAEKKKKRKRKRSRRREEIEAPDAGLEIMAKKEWKRLRNKYLDMQKAKMHQLKQHLKRATWHQWQNVEKMKTEKEETIEKTKEKNEPRFNFTPGVIVRVEMETPCSDPQNFKMEIKGSSSSNSIKYVDIREGSNVAFVRFDSVESSKSFVQKTREDRTMVILEGDEEKAYWEKMAMDRKDKVENNIRVKQRGRDKLLKKAEKELGKHIKFDEV